MRMPDVRKRLGEVADLVECRGLFETAAEIRALSEATRRQFFGRAEVKNHMGRGFAARVRRYAADHPDAHVQDIAAALGVNLGRVAPILNPRVKP